MKIKNLFSNFKLGFVIIFLVGAIGHYFLYTREVFKSITPYLLLLINLVFVYKIYITKNLNLIFWCILTFLITFTVEIIGVRTGIIFGEYSYGNILGLKLFDVPIIIGINWVIIILGSILLAQKILKSNISIPIMTSYFVILFDFVMEPVAIKLGYWDWIKTFPTLKNYIAWGTLGFIFSLIYKLLKINFKSELLEEYIILQFLFFLILNLSI